LRRNPKEAPFADIDRVLRDEGFDRAETGGSHKAYRHPPTARHPTLSPHGDMVKGYQIREALAAVDEVRAKKAEEAAKRKGGNPMSVRHVDYTQEDSDYVARIPELPGLVTGAST
jgi:predicted RNA binding protein YcfA (HicA-like mRNA interferase family)